MFPKAERDTAGVRSNSSKRLPAASSSHAAAVICCVIFVCILHFSGRYFFRATPIGPAIAEFLTLVSVLLMSGWTYTAATSTYTLKGVRWTFSAGTLLIILVQIARIVQSLPNAAATLPFLDTAFYEAAREGTFASGVALFLASFYWSLYEADAMKSALQKEKSDLTREVAQRRQTLAALEESEEKYRSLVESFPHSVIIFQDGRIVFANEAVASTLRVSDADALLGVDPSDFVAPSERQRLQDYLDARLKGDTSIPSPYETVLVRSDGQEFPSLQYVRMISFGGKPAMQIVGMDVTELRQAERTLILKNAAIEASSTPLAFADMEGILTSVNPAFLRQWAYDSLDEVVGKPVTNFWQDEEQAKKTLQTLRQDGYWNGELVARRKDDSRLIISVAATVARDPDGTPLCLMSSFIDITEQRRMQEALRQGEETLRTLVAANPESLLLLDANYNIVTANETAAQRVQMTRERFIGRNVFDFLSPEVADLRKRFFREVRKTRRACRFEDTRSGRCFENHIQPIFDANGEITGYAVMGTDITERTKMEDELRNLNATLEQRVETRTAELTRSNQQLQEEVAERKQAERALQDSEAKYRELVQNANSIILRMDIRGNVTFFNEFAQRFFGYSEQEILGRNVVGTIVPETDDEGRDLSAMIGDIGIHPDDYSTNENQNIRRNGERVWIAWTNRPIRGGDGSPLEILCIGNDVTERVRAEHVIAEQRIKMINAARMSALGVMAGGIAHEINNPLAIISVAAQQLDSILNNPDPNMNQVLKITDAVVRNVERVQRIVRALRSLSRQTPGDPFEKASVTDIMNDVLELCQERFKTHGISLSFPDIQSSTEIECRASQLSQVILNLLNNAYDAAIRMPEKWVRLEVEEQPDHVIFSVTDSGRGLSPESRMNLFVPFFTTKREGAGTGLGLSISRNIIEGHNGELMLDASSANTKFLVRVPKRQFAREVSVESEYRPHTHGENARNHSAS